MKRKSTRLVTDASPAQRIRVLLVALIFILIGLAMIISGIDTMLTAKASFNWPQADGIILKSDVDKSTDDDGSKFWHANISYSYSVNGIKLEGSQITFFGDYGSSNISHAFEVVGKYPVGKKVKVYYAPNDSKECLLEPGIRGMTYFQFVFGFIFFSGSMFAFIVMLIAKPDRKKEPDMENCSQ